MRVFAYLRASTDEQDATRAKQELRTFATEKGFDICHYYIENASGTTRERPALKNLLLTLQKGDVILLESIDRLTRLDEENFNILKNQIQEKGASIVAVDLPITHVVFAANEFNDDFMRWFFNAQTELMITMAAAFARQDYKVRRKRTLEGIAKAKAQGKFKGRPDDLELQSKIKDLLNAGLSYRKIQKTIGAAPATIAKVKRSIQ